MEKRIQLTNTATGWQVFVQRSIPLYNKLGISAMESMEVCLKSLMFPEQIFDWKNITFYTTEWFSIHDEIMHREYHYDEKTNCYHLYEITLGGVDTPFAYKRYPVSELPDFLMPYYEALKEEKLLQSMPLECLRGNIVFATDQDLTYFEESQSFFKCTRDLEMFISAFLKEDGPFLVSRENGFFIATSGEERRKIIFRNLDSETIEVHKGFERNVYQINPIAGVLYQP